MDHTFSSEHLVVITSKTAIDVLQWRKYIIDNWTKVMRKNSKLLVLAGVHGDSEGKIGHKDGGLFKDYQKAVKFLTEHKNSPIDKSDFEEKGMQIILEDVGSHLGPDLDPERLVSSIKRHNPTVISLAFCYTDISELNDILRSSGIYTVLIMSKDRENITEGSYAVLDPAQKDIIESCEKAQQCFPVGKLWHWENPASLRSSQNEDQPVQERCSAA